MAERLPTPEERRRYALYIENLVCGLFGKSEFPFFASGQSYVLIDEFIACDEVFYATFQYAQRLMDIWKSRYPDKPKLTVNQPAKKITFPDLSVKTDSEQQKGQLPDSPIVSSAASLSPKEVTKTSMATDSSAGTSNIPSGNNESGTLGSGGTTISAPSPAISQSTATPVGSAKLNIGAKPGQIPTAGTPPGTPHPPKATFHVPNAKASQPYLGILEGTDSNGAKVKIRGVKFQNDIGLSFDESTGELRGTPSLDGEHILSLQWSSDGSSWLSSTCLLIVNPDPRSLWKKIDPDPNDPYFKPNTDECLVRCKQYSLIGASRRGRSHEHSGTFRDDDLFLAHDDKSEWSVLIVADGAGSAKSSRWGSKLAVKAFGDHIYSQLTGDLGMQLTSALTNWNADPVGTAKTLGTKFHYLYHKAGTLAVQAIETEAQTTGGSPKEYSTTLLAAAVRYDVDDIFLATFWMGDGAIAAYGPQGKVRLMGTPDGGEFAGQTRFLDRAALADQSFANRVKIGRYPDIKAVLLMTDGISDPRFETDNGLADAQKWDSLWAELNPMIEQSEPGKALVDWLDFFTPGHHDDRTIAILS